MGMDVVGRAPEGPGSYFRASIWAWPVIWQTAEQAAPDLARKVQYPWSNDGSGLNGKDARALGEAILRFLNEDDEARGRGIFRLADGERAEELAHRHARVASGLAAAVAGGPGDAGEIVAGQDGYWTDRGHIQAFAQFCIASGGFSIW